MLTNAPSLISPPADFAQPLHDQDGPVRPLPHLEQGLYGKVVKRAFDVTLAAVGLILALPLLVLLAVLVRLSSRGPAFLRQVRVGRGGRPFPMLKFRTMIDGAEAPGCPVWSGDGDARVTRLGRLLRLTHLDELPQLANVLAGHMSLVGPRPERPELDAMLQAEIPFWSVRYAVRPGLTGWAQVRQGYTASVEAAREKLAHDYDYLSRCSFALDVSILAETLGGVARALRR